MLQLREYRPEINMATETSIANELTAAGNQPLYFKQLSTSSFAISYQSEGVMTFEEDDYLAIQKCLKYFRVF